MAKRKVRGPWKAYEGQGEAPTTQAQRWQRIQVREGQGRCRVDRPANIDWRAVSHWRFA